MSTHSGRTATAGVLVLGPNQLGAIGDFTTTSVAQVSKYLGPSTRRAVLTCDTQAGRIPIVEWKDFVLEGGDGNYSAYVYAAGGMNSLGALPASVASGSVIPALSTSRGITLGSTVAQLRAAYPRAITEAIGSGSEYSWVVIVNATDVSNSSLDFTTTSDTPKGQVVSIDAGDSVYCPIS